MYTLSFCTELKHTLLQYQTNSCLHVPENRNKICNIPFWTPMANTRLSRTRKEKSRFHTHPDTSVAIMAASLSLNISHFYNTERGNIGTTSCFPWTIRRRKLPSIRKNKQRAKGLESWCLIDLGPPVLCMNTAHMNENYSGSLFLFHFMASIICLCLVNSWRRVLYEES